MPVSQFGARTNINVSEGGRKEEWRRSPRLLRPRIQGQEEEVASQTLGDAQAPHPPRHPRPGLAGREGLRHQGAHDAQRRASDTEAHARGHRDEVLEEDPGDLPEGHRDDNHKVRDPLREQGLRGGDWERGRHRRHRLFRGARGARLQLRHQRGVPGRGEEKPREVRARGST